MKKKILSIIFMLIIQLATISQTELPSLQNFEGNIFPPINWQVFHGDSGSTDWELSPMGVGASSSSYSALFNNIEAPSTFFVLRCESLNLINATSPIVSFEVAYARFDNSHSDDLSLWYTTNTNGATDWTRVVDATTLSNVTYTGSELDTAPNQTTYFTPTDTQWETKHIDLGNYAGLAYIRFAFESIPDNDNGQNVIYIDNVHFYDDDDASIPKDLKINFEIYPNPNTGIMRLKTDLKNVTIKDIKILNTIGQEFSNFRLSTKNNGYQINLEHLPTGIYFITIQSQHQKSSKMFVVE